MYCSHHGHDPRSKYRSVKCFSDESVDSRGCRVQGSGYRVRVQGRAGPAKVTPKVRGGDLVRYMIGMSGLSKKDQTELGSPFMKSL